MKISGDYAGMWEDFAKRKAHSYLTDKYDLRNIVGLVGRAREHEIMRALQLTSDDVLLDVGCASGRQVFMAAPYIKKGVGVDIAKGFTDAAAAFAAEKGIKNTEFVHVDAEHLPFPDGSFTKLICSEVIEHIPDPMPLLNEIKRVLVPGGTAVFTVPNLNSRGTLWKRMVYGFKEPPFSPLSDFSMDGIHEHGDAHVHQFTIPRFRKLIEDAGFSVSYTGGAAFIDGPKIGRIIQITNSIGLFQVLTFFSEKLIAGIPFLKILGRQIILRAHTSQRGL